MVLLVSACTDSPAAPTPEPITVDTTEAVSQVGVDDVLRVGVVLPLTGEGSELGISMAAAIELAISEIDLAGGVKSNQVDVEVVDETTLHNAATPMLAELFDGDIDAMIGPASSVVAARLLPIAVDARVLTCSPTASAMSLDDFPDADSLFIRTIPSDSLQAKALARQIDGTGATRVVLVYIDDNFGRPFAEIVRDELIALGAVVADFVAFDPADTDFVDEARAIAADEPVAVGVIGDRDAGPRLVQALFGELDDGVEIRINDAMRVPATVSAYRRLAEDALVRLQGVSPRSGIVDPLVAARFGDVGPVRRYFAANAYDCMNVIALAANASNVIDGESMADQIADVTTGGTSCVSFTACFDQLQAQRSIDYDGPNAELDLGSDGDPISGVFDTFSFDSEGVDQTDLSTSFRVSG